MGAWMCVCMTMRACVYMHACKYLITQTCKSGGTYVIMCTCTDWYQVVARRAGLHHSATYCMSRDGAWRTTLSTNTGSTVTLMRYLRGGA